MLILLNFIFINFMDALYLHYNIYFIYLSYVIVIAVMLNINKDPCGHENVE